MKRTLKHILLVLLFVAIIAVVGIIIYSITCNKKILGDIIPINVSGDIDDYHNGVYFYDEPLDRSYAVYSGCNVSSFTSYIVVMNDVYYEYYGSCMKNSKVSDGKTEDLVFIVNKDTNEYQISYNDKTYKKNDKVNKVVEDNYLQNSFTSTTIDVFDFVLKYGDMSGDYQPLNVSLMGSTGKFQLSFTYNSQTKVFLEKIQSNNTDIYSYTYLDINKRPLYDFIENNLVSLEQTQVNGSGDSFIYRNNLVLLGEGKKKYDLTTEFPIKVNGTRVDNNRNIYIKKKSNSTYGMLVGDLNTFCDNDKKDSDEISYYEFEIKYNYSTKNFDSPEFKKVGKYSEGCTYVKKYYFGG